jgi:hypothetical protein
MPRKPRKIKATATEDVRISMFLPADDVRALDAEAVRRTDEDAYGRTLTRSDVVRMAVHQFVSKEAS